MNEKTKSIVKSIALVFGVIVVDKKFNLSGKIMSTLGL